MGSAGSDCSGVTGFYQCTFASSGKNHFIQGCLTAGQGDVGSCQEIVKRWVSSLTLSAERSCSSGWDGQCWELSWQSGVLEKSCWDPQRHLSSQVRGQNCSSSGGLSPLPSVHVGAPGWGCWASLALPWRGFFFTPPELF